MAKNRKVAPKRAKKSAAKSKTAIKNKKTAPSKPVKKTKAKKSTPKKEVAKKSPPKKIVVAKVKKEKNGVVKPEKKNARVTEKQTPVEKAAPVAKVLPPQLNIFPVLNQRPIAHRPAKVNTVKDERSRYSEEELKEFEVLINKKLDKAKEEYRILKDTLNRNNDEGTDATSGGNTKVLEDGAETAEKENLSQLAARQQKYITNLENALIRIKNGTYGICSVTGKLIPKERLIAVPHTTQSIEAKMMQQD